jgi:hypothetical protein
LSDPSDLSHWESRSKIVAAYGSLLIPIALFVGTWSINRSQRVSDASERCHQQALTLFDEALNFKPEASPIVRDIATQKVSVRSSLLRQTCRLGHVTLPTEVGERIDALASQAPVAAVSKQLQTNGTAIVTDAQAGTQTTAITPSMPTQPPPEKGSVRLFIHISNEDQRNAARSLQTLVESEKLRDGVKITVPGIQLVDRQNNSTLRCLKKVDCARATEIANLLVKLTRDHDIRILDLSSRYDSEPGVHVGTYELWLSDGALSVRP